MPPLHVHFQTGFDGDAVELLVDDETVYSEPGVTESPMLGVAAEFELDDHRRRPRGNLPRRLRRRRQAPVSHLAGTSTATVRRSH